ncbi:MAG: hypothetical protein ABSG96_16690 [Terracidiphilus sp.]
MTRDENPNLQLLNALAEINGKIKDRAIELRRLFPRALWVQHSLEPVSNLSGPGIEGYLDILFEGQIGVCWSLEASWDREFWKIEANLYRQSPAGQETVISIPEETHSEFQGSMRALKRIADNLLALEIDRAGTGPWTTQT